MSDEELSDIEEGNVPYVAHAQVAQQPIVNHFLTPEQKQHYQQLPDADRMAYLSTLINTKIGEEPFADTPAFQQRIQTVIENYLIEAKGEQYTDDDILLLLHSYSQLRENTDLHLVENQFRVLEIEEKKKENDFLKQLGRDGMKLQEAKTEGKMTKAMIEIALQRNGEAIQFIPIQMRTPEIIKLALLTTPKAIRFIGLSNQTLEYAELAFRNAVKDDPDAIKYIREDLLQQIVEKESIKKT